MPGWTAVAGVASVGLADASILVAESEGNAAESAASRLIEAGAEVNVARAESAAVALLNASKPHIIVAEVRWPEGCGFNILEAARRLHPRVPVILFTGNPNVNEAVHAMREGAESYLPKPFGSELIRAVRLGVDRGVRLDRERLPVRVPRAIPPKGLVGDSPVMRELLAQVALVGPTRTTVLLQGETGTGKERLAEALHDASPRRNAPFVAVNCAALTETVLESELFGHERGSFSGAHVRREGRFKVADGGTVFLDEIGEISPSTQVKLLRVLQERRFERVGGNETLSVDVRIIAATNRRLRDMVEDKSFRADLFYRLNVVVLDVPPLRARKEDLPALIQHILPRLALDLGIREPVLTPEATQVLTAYDWPGNVRELENVLERAVVLSRGAPITQPMLSPEMLGARPDPVASPAWPPLPGATFAEIERHAILKTYEACGRSPQKTAAILGLSPRTIHYRLREYSGRRGRRIQAPDCTPCATPSHSVR
jgi:DNA-binding NtrC family response regulator